MLTGNETNVNETPASETNNTETPATAPVIKSKPKASKSAKAKTAKVKRGRGRPPVYGKQDTISIVSAVKKHGNIKKATAALQERFPNISVPTVAKLAHKAGLTFHRGRPKTKTVKAKATKPKAVKVKAPEPQVA